jgi:acetolactate synthase I/II/III large subunit
MKTRVADYIAEFIHSKGVDRVFLLSGGGMMHLQDGLGRHPGIRPIYQHHEQSCVFAAEAYGRQRHSIGVCYVTSGPGASNTVTGIVSAYQDSSPVLVIAGQAKISDTMRGTQQLGLRQLGTFEVDMLPIVESITKYAVFLNDPQTVRFHLEKAFALATTGRPGPVYLEVPLDIQGAWIETDLLAGWTEPVAAALAPNAAELEQCYQALRTAQRPLLVAGHGLRCAQATAGFVKLAEQLQIPVVTTQMAADLIPHNHPLYVGHLGVKGDRAGNFAVQSADLILFIGTSLRAQTTGYELSDFAPRAHKIHVDPEQAVLDSTRFGVNLKLRADVGLFVAALAEYVTGSQTPPVAPVWHARTQHWKLNYALAREDHSAATGILSYYQVIHALAVACPPETTVVADAGCAFYITGQAFQSKPSQRLIFCGALAQMGYTLPAVTGACAAAPGRTIVGVTGDGSLMTNLHELSVIVHNQLNAKILVINNGGYSCIRNTQIGYFGAPVFGTDPASGVGFPDLSQLCSAHRLPYMTERDPVRLDQALARFLSTPGPILFEVHTQAEQAFVPTVASVRLDSGRLQSKPLHDMTPLLPPERIEAEMRFD